MSLLTAPGGEFALESSLCEMLAYFDDGRLFVSKSHAFNPHVRAFQGRLNRLGRQADVHMVDMTHIAKLYAAERDATYGTKGQSASKTQADAKDIFKRAVEKRASDIHIRVSKNLHTRIYFRVHGSLTFIEEHQYDYGMQLCSTIYQAMADVSDATFQEMSRQDARIADKSKIPPGLDGIRIATTPQVDGILMVLRMLYNDTSPSSDVEDLGYQREQSDAVRFMRRRPTGINIISGPTGSGKSTTLQRILTGIYQETHGKRHIITVEDPPEYPILGAVQTPVTNADGEEARSAAFQKAIKAAMRLDPDVIMVGEIRDMPTARLAIQAAMTGHQVWTTLHANNALAIIDRLVDLGVSRELIADPSIISGLISQRLVQRLCDHCKRPLQGVLPSLDRRDADRIMGAVHVESTFVIGPGCPHCNQSGISGRVALAEIIVTDHTFMKFVRHNSKAEALDYWRNAQGGKSMIDVAIDAVNRGHVDPLAAEEIVGPLSLARIESDHRVDRLEVAGV